MARLFSWWPTRIDIGQDRRVFRCVSGAVGRRCGMEQTLSPMMPILGDASRARLLCLLMDGRAFTGKELSCLVGLSASTTSEHLTLLRDAGLIRSQRSGRTVYHALAGDKVAVALEGLVPLSPAPVVATPMAQARCCYDHLAGELGVAMAGALMRMDVLAWEDGLLVKGAGFADGVGRLGLTLPAGRPAVRSCLDWTARKAHVGGGLGAAILAQALDAGWVARGLVPRVLTVTAAGQGVFAERYGVTL
jgi:DNA-binding transcriptional ArsR family regulator